MTQELEPARYSERRLAERRYEAVNPDQRLSCGSNVALQKTRELERAAVQECEVETTNVPLPSKELLLN